MAGNDSVKMSEVPDTQKNKMRQAHLPNSDLQTKFKSTNFVALTDTCFRERRELRRKLPADHRAGNKKRTMILVMLASNENTRS